MTSAQGNSVWVLASLSPDLIRSIGWSLIHFLWQGALLLLLFLAVQRFIRAPALRYAFAYGTMLAMAAAPIITFCLINGEIYPAATPAFSASRRTEMHGLGWLVSAWTFGVAILSLRLAGGWYRAVALSRSGTALPLALLLRCDELCERLLISRPVRFLQSAAVHAPAVIGWLRPVVLIPTSAVLGLSSSQLEAVILHELAHIRRFDFIANIGQAVIEIALFYHPAVWWISRRIRIEREHCCDDIAVALSGDAFIYARTLADLAERPSLPSLAMAASGGYLAQRIARLLGSKTQLDRAAAVSAIGISLVCSAMFGVAHVIGERPRLTPPSLAQTVPMVPDLLTDVKSAAPPAPVLPMATARPSNAASALPVPRPRPASLVAATSGDKKPSSATVFARAARKAWPEITSREIAALKERGVTLQDLARIHDDADTYRNLGLAGVSLHHLYSYHSVGVTPDYVQSLKDAGIDVTELAPFDMVAYKVAGVTPELIAALRSMNLKELKNSDYAIAQVVGLTPEFLGRVRNHNFRNLTLEALIVFKNANVFG